MSKNGKIMKKKDGSFKFDEVFYTQKESGMEWFSTQKGNDNKLYCIS